MRRLAAMLAVLSGCASVSSPPSRVERPPPAPPPAAEDARWEVARQADGLRIVHAPAAPSFEALLWFPTRLADEPATVPGAHGLMAQAATLGTLGDPDRHTTPARRALLAGGALSVVDTGDGVGWHVTGPSDAAPSLLQLLFDVASRPTMPTTRVHAMTERRRETLTLARDPHVAHAAAWATGVVLGRGGPAAAWATPEALGAVHREDLVRLHARVIRPERGAIVAAGAPAAQVRRAAAGWTVPDAPPAPPPPCASPPPHQLYLGAPPTERAVVVALAVPARRAPDRAALDALLAEQAAAADVRVDAALVDLGDRAALLVSSRGRVEAAAERVGAWLRRLAGPDLAARAALGRALAVDAARRDGGSAAAWIDAARAAMGPAPDPDAAQDPAALERVASTLRDTDAHVRIALGPDDALRALRAWGPAVDLSGRTRMCGDSEANVERRDHEGR